MIGDLEVRFWMPDGLKVENNECKKKIEGTEPVEVRIVTKCDVAKQAENQLLVRLQFDGMHSAFWSQENLPSVWVSATYIPCTQHTTCTSVALKLLSFKKAL